MVKMNEGERANEYQLPAITLVNQVLGGITLYSFYHEFLGMQVQAKKKKKAFN